MFEATSEKSYGARTAMITRGLVPQAPPRKIYLQHVEGGGCELPFFAPEAERYDKNADTILAKYSRITTTWPPSYPSLKSKSNERQVTVKGASRERQGH